MKPAQCTGPCQPGGGLPVLPRRSRSHFACLYIAQPIRLGRNRQTRHKPLDVPFPWSRQRLIEVVEIEYELAFGRCKEPEIRQMTVATRLHCDPRDGGGW